MSPRRNESITVSVDITNKSEVDGAEIVQLYIQDISSTYVRPVKELKGFQKCWIPSGQTKRVTFTVNHTSLSYKNEHNESILEPGEFRILIGPNSATLESRTITYHE